MKLLSIVVLLALLAAAACSEPLEFADWTIPVPEGTRIIGYAPVPLEERTDRIELVEDLVIGAGTNDPNYLFNFGLTEKDVAVDDEGRIYVVDGINRRVQVFDASGNYLRTLGRQGEGPGEFGRPPARATIAGGHVFVAENSGSTLQEWSADGEYVGRRDTGEIRRFSDLEGTDDGDFIVSHAVAIPNDMYRRILRISRLSPDGESVIFERADPVMPLRPSPRNKSVMVPPSIMLGMFRPQFASTLGGTIYLSAADEYQIVALDEAGTARWALRVAGKRREVTEAMIEGALAAYRQRLSRRSEGGARTVTRDDVGVLGPYPSVGWMEVDGHGHLYVFPYTNPFATDPVVPVDVFSADGERLFTGMLAHEGDNAASQRWRAVLGNDVYTIGEDEQSGEEVVYRYRLVEPFD